MNKDFNKSIFIKGIQSGENKEILKKLFEDINKKDLEIFFNRNEILKNKVGKTN